MLGRGTGTGTNKQWNKLYKVPLAKIVYRQHVTVLRNDTHSAIRQCILCSMSLQARHSTPHHPQTASGSLHLCLDMTDSPADAESAVASQQQSTGSTATEPTQTGSGSPTKQQPGSPSKGGSGSTFGGLFGGGGSKGSGSVSSWLPSWGGKKEPEQVCCHMHIV